MKILLTGATGYIGKRLLSVLVRNGHHVVCLVRDAGRFNPPAAIRDFVSVVEGDLLRPETLRNIPADIDGAYYLVHSMSSSEDYSKLEENSAINFREALDHTHVKHVIYLGGIVNEAVLSEHLQSRKNVEDELARGHYQFTAFRAGIIIGSGSASFEIIRDLVEKLPVMVAPRWLNTRCQPIGISDVLIILSRAILRPETYGQHFDIGGSDILTYKEMLLGYAEARGLRRSIWTVPVMTPRLSSYWLYFVTSTSYKLARTLVDSMSVEVVCGDSRINIILGLQPLSYRQAIDKAFARIESDDIESSWKDANVSSGFNNRISDFIQVPEYGCFIDKRTAPVADRERCLERIWCIGGETGWYYGNLLWAARGFIDKMVGGVGLRRGRTNRTTIHAGDTLDFWRVLYANKQEGRLLLFAEMKLPGEAWLEFRLEGDKLVQTATFRPLGVAGRLYWYSVLVFHGFIFSGMIRKLTAA